MAEALSVQALIQKGQTRFLMDGGMYAIPLEILRDKGILPREYVFQEFPKAIPVGDSSLTVASRDEEKRLTTLLERADDLGVHIAAQTTFDALEQQVEIAESLAGQRAARLDPKAATRARLERMQAEMQRLTAELGEDSEAPAAGGLTPESAPAAGSSSKRPRRDLPVVAD